MDALAAENGSGKPGHGRGKGNSGAIDHLLVQVVGGNAVDKNGLHVLLDIIGRKAGSYNFV